MSHLADVVRWVLWVVAINAALQNHNSWAMAIHQGACVLVSDKSKTSAAPLGCNAGAPPPDQSIPSCMSVPLKLTLLLMIADVRRLI